jgi:hypothetical protein
MEKRSQVRYDDRGTVICSYFNADRCYDGQALNFCQKGMCFCSDGSFKPGTTVLIRLAQGPTGQSVRHADGAVRSMTLARVQWCRPDKDKPGCRYTSGVQYL